jgi:hypothetical protein
MQQLINIITIFLAFCLALSGCAGKAYISDPGHSFARNVTKAGGLNVKDVPWEKVQKAREEALAKGAPVANSEPSVLGAASYGVVHGLNMSSLLSGGLGALAWMSTGNSVDPAIHNQVFVWMPMEMAEEARGACEKIMDMVRDAYEKALSETTFPPGYSISTELETRVIRERYKKTGYFGSVEGMSNSDIEVAYGEIRPLEVMKAFRLTPVKVLPEPGVGPDFISPGKVWSYRFPLIAGRTVLDLRQKPAVYLPELPDFEVYKRTSELLPEWVVLYLSPRQYISMADGKGGFTFLEYPVVLHQGQIHYFIEPPPKS